MFFGRFLVGFFGRFFGRFFGVLGVLGVWDFWCRGILVWLKLC